MRHLLFFALAFCAAPCHAILVNDYVPDEFGYDAWVGPLGFASVQPGDQYRIMAVSSVTLTADSVAIADYNAVVQQIGDASVFGAPGVTWSAVMSTPSVSARQNVGDVADGVPVYDYMGRTLAFDLADVWEFKLYNPVDSHGYHLRTPIEVAENGRIWNPNVFPWTGTNADGSPAIGNEVGQANVQYGGTQIQNQGWLELTAAPSSEFRQFYIVSSVITAVPEPSAALLVGGVGLVAVLLQGRRRAAFLVNFSPQH